MKTSLRLYLSALLLLAGLCSSHKTSAAVVDTLFVSLKNNSIYAFPAPSYQATSQDADSLYVTTTDDRTFGFALADIVYQGKTQPELPRITSFKFNNKFNDEVFEDVIADISAGGDITASVPSIGKRLTPSFKLSDSLAVVYVDGVQQRSKRSRLRFDKPITYLVANPAHQVLRKLEASETEEQETFEEVGTPVITPVALTAEMLSTNAPSNNGEDLENLLDGDLNTMFHSTWSDGIYPKLANDAVRYIDVHLPEAIHHLTFGYNNRSVATNRYTKLLRLYASTDGLTWQAIRDFDYEADGLPTEPGERYDSPIVSLGGLFSYLRFEQRACAYNKNHLAWAEFSLSSVTYPEATPSTTVPRQWDWAPLGRSYTVYIDWPQTRTVQVPRIDINVEYGEMIDSKDYYKEAYITIDGAGMFPSLESTAVKVKGRGNTSWDGTNPYAKNPYRLKFSSKLKPFGLKAGKNWVLLANKQNGSMTSNAIGMKVARLMGAAGANHIIPVELYINGQYRGSYQFTEKVGFSNNSIEPEDETLAALLELDKYYDETYKFTDYTYRLPVNIKEPDFSDPTSTKITFSDIEGDFNTFVGLVSNHADISAKCDVKALAAFYATNELIGNQELMHPKSTYLYKENYQDPDSKYVFGPVWDLDWAFGYERRRTYFKEYATSPYTETAINSKNQFWRDLRQCGEPLDKAFYRLWSRFMNNGGLDELIEYCDDYYAYAQPSLENNATKWTDGYGYATITANAKSWLQERAEYVFGQQTVYDLSDEEEEDEPDDPEDEDPITVTAKDVSMVYGASVPALTFTTKGGTLQGTPSLSTTATSQSVVGTYPITVTKGSVTNKNVTYVAGTLTVNPASLTVYADDAQVVRGQAFPVFTYTYKGFRNGDTEATAITKKPVVSTDATSSSPIGTYSLIVSGGESKNYELGYINGTLTIVNPTGINEVSGGKSESKWFDLNGHRVNPANLRPGIYIKDGKKVVII